MTHGDGFRESTELEDRLQELAWRLSENNARLKRENAALLKAERVISDAYLRVRALVNAYDTSHGGADRFAVTERLIKDLIEENKRLKSDLLLNHWESTRWGA